MFLVAVDITWMVSVNVASDNVTRVASRTIASDDVTRVGSTTIASDDVTHVVSAAVASLSFVVPPATDNNNHKLKYKNVSVCDEET